MKKKIALITFSDYPDLTPDDQQILPFLKQLNINYDICIWDDPQVRWDQYICLVLRSAWDYTEGKVERFRNFLTRIETQGIPLFNDPKIIKWNLDKEYFQDLASAQIPYLETRYLSFEQLFHLKDIVLQEGWKGCILKPRISNRGIQTYRIEANQLELFTQIFRWANPNQLPEQWLIQPIYKEFFQEGEWTFIFIDGLYAHGALKKAESQNLICNEVYSKFVPENWMVEQATSYLHKLQLDHLLYVRVDGIRVGNQIVINEVEVNGPQLFFACNLESAFHFAKAIDKRIQTVSHSSSIIGTPSASVTSINRQFNK